MRGWLLWLALACLILSQAEAADCGKSQATIASLRRNATVSVAAETARVGTPVRIAWSQPGEADRTAAYLMIATDKPVRLSGEGLYGLTPRAEAPFRIQRFAGLTRVVIPLYGDGVKRASSFDVTFLVPGLNTLRWDVVGHDGCRESAGEGDGRQASVTVSAGGRPSLVIGDPVDKAKPASLLLSADGARLLEVYEGRYRLLDASNGAELVERAGTEPRFSPTGRFVGAQEQDGFTVLDAVDGAHILVVGDVLDIAWDNADSFFIAGGHRYCNVYGANTLRTDAPVYESDLALFRVCRGTDEIAYRIDLEYNLAVFSSKQGSFTLKSITKGTSRSEQAAAMAAPSVPDHDNTIRLTNTTSASKPFVMPKIWESRGGLVFTHLYLPPVEERTQADKALARFLLKPRASLSLPAKNATPTIVSSISRSAWRSATLLAEPRGVTLDRFEKRLVEFGFTFLPTTLADETIGKFDAGHEKELSEKQALRVATRISSEISAARGKFEYVDLRCQSESPDLLNSRINVARRWKLDSSRIVWITWLGCIEGSAGFYFSNLYIFDSKNSIAKKTGVEKLDDLNLSYDDTDSSTSCDYGIHYCLNNAEIHGDRYIIFTSQEGRAFAIYDLTKQNLLTKRFNLSRGTLLSRVRLTASIEHAVQINSDGTFFTYRLADGAQILAGSVVDDEVVVALPDGRFDATAEGAEMVRLRFPGLLGEHALGQFSAKLRLPGLLSTTLAGNPPSAAAAIGTPPTLSASIERTDGARVKIVANAEGSTPIATIRLYEDGVFTAEHRYPADGTGLSVTFIPLPGTRWISLLAVDSEGLASAPAGRDIGAGQGSLRNVHAVAAGVNRYEDPAITPLDSPRRDADAFIGALKAPGSGLNPASALLLLDSDASPTRIKESLSAAIDAAKPGDTVMLFFAGHGAQESGRFYLATSGTRLSDIPGTALAWDELSPILAKAKGRVVVFLDACHSGAAGTKFFATNDASAGALLAAMPSNIVVLAAAKGRELAEETPAGGAFTRALIDVIGPQRQSHDLNGNGVIELSEFYRGVKTKVRAMTGGKQTPWFARNQMVGDFALF